MTKCEECYRKIDGEHIVAPLRDISFLTLNLQMAFRLIERLTSIKLSKHEKDTMKKLFDIYAPIIHYWSSGQFYNMPKEEHKKFKFRHKSYM